MSGLRPLCPIRKALSLSSPQPGAIWGRLCLSLGSRGDLVCTRQPSPDFLGGSVFLFTLTVDTWPPSCATESPTQLSTASPLTLKPSHGGPRRWPREVGRAQRAGLSSPHSALPEPLTLAGRVICHDVETEVLSQTKPGRWGGVHVLQPHGQGLCSQLLCLSQGPSSLSLSLTLPCAAKMRCRSVLPRTKARGEQSSVQMPGPGVDVRS